MVLEEHNTQMPALICDDYALLALHCDDEIIGDDRFISTMNIFIPIV